MDETGFLKKGRKPRGGARRYSGTAGATADCQVGAFLAYASAGAAAVIDRAPYLPECGKWETAYKRYRLWRAIGLRQRILEVLPEGGREASL